MSINTKRRIMFRPTPRQVAAAAHLGWDVTLGRGLERPYTIFHKKSRFSKKHVKFMLDVAPNVIASQYGSGHDAGRKRLRGSVTEINATDIPSGSIYTIDEALQSRWRFTVARFCSRTPEHRNVSNEGDVQAYLTAYFAMILTDGPTPKSGSIKLPTIPVNRELSRRSLGDWYEKAVTIPGIARPINPAPPYILCESYKGGKTKDEQLYDLFLVYERAIDHVTRLLVEGLI